jgi:hypothetical protein
MEDQFAVVEDSNSSDVSEISTKIKNDELEGYL